MAVWHTPHALFSVHHSCPNIQLRLLTCHFRARLPQGTRLKFTQPVTGQLHYAVVDCRRVYANCFYNDCRAPMMNYVHSEALASLLNLVSLNLQVGPLGP